MQPVNILDARNNLSRLVAVANGGEDVVIAKRGVPVARLVGITDADSAHSAANAAVWLTTHHVPARASRSVQQLDEQIADERRGWE